MNWRRELSKMIQESKIIRRQNRKQNRRRKHEPSPNYMKLTFTSDLLYHDRTIKILERAQKTFQTINADVISIDNESKTITGMVRSITVCPTS